MDIIDLIDQAITPTCGQCGTELAGSLSDDFCGPGCQRAWHEARSEPLIGYREPSDVPEHVHNLVELSSPETTPDEPTLTPRFFSEQAYRDYLERFPRTRAVVGRPRVEPANYGLLRDMADYQRYTWAGPRLTHPLDTGAPWIRSPITPQDASPSDGLDALRYAANALRPNWARTQTAIFIGGPRHGQTIPLPVETRPSIEVYVPQPGYGDFAAFTSDRISLQRHVYQLSHSDRDRWYYLYDQHTDTTIPATDRHPELTVERYHEDRHRDSTSARVTDGQFFAVGNFPNELLADLPALRAWFDHHKARVTQPVTDGSLIAPPRMPGPWTSPDGRLTITCERRREHHILRVFDGQHVTVHQYNAPLDQIPLVLREVCRQHEADRRRADAGYPDPRFPVDGSWEITEPRPPFRREQT